MLLLTSESLFRDLVSDFAIPSLAETDKGMVDAVLRSTLYSHFSESLTGLATIRAYGESERFRLENEQRIDIENR